MSRFHLSYTPRISAARYKGDIEARYSTNKGKLPPEMIEDIRAQYKACEPFLSTISELEESVVVKEAQIEALKSIAKNLLGIDLLDVKVAKERELQKELTPAGVQRQSKESRGHLNPQSCFQRLVYVSAR
jgi:hypothetical protein